ncbi:chaperone modulator CbpM [Syntrophobacter fumaroxidans]|uniref:Putative transcriptional regulator, MerR family n=1 Tax=Syntrophobacter fumaroxidans (strain DSM 10017 / MPOB) TaxID=335543 RepID=A0LEW1_SYNFM|nr:chaperone modulator CbpM [Syntrophobacter fumaroxidans]ABK15963.1 putative transcriptional regulator, MerR family [Syntrophobacter fumaroxidans MPOB]HOI93246.1 chaperone modulator CbpM [Syntrophobacter fumaroxidans]
MVEKRYFMINVKTVTSSSPFLTRNELAVHCGIHPDLIDRFIRLGLIDFMDRDSDGEAVFSAEVIPLVRRILRLRNELGVNYAGIGVVLELMARVETLENHIKELESRIFA